MELVGDQFNPLKKKKIYDATGSEFLESGVPPQVHRWIVKWLGMDGPSMSFPTTADAGRLCREQTTESWQVCLCFL